MKKENNQFIEKAAQQILIESLGYDEGIAYYLLLTKKEKELKKEFSYSKKYRLLKNLFDFGAVGKFKPGNQDFFNYFILPPTFLYSEKVDTKIIDFLEELYLKNHSKILEVNFSQIILKDEKILLIFLLKYFMKDSAKLITNDSRINNTIGEKRNKVIILERKEINRRIGIIDNNFAFEFFDILNKDVYESVGYLANDNRIKNISTNNSDYISKIEKELKQLN
jgi:hypothetical protein